MDIIILKGKGNHQFHLGRQDLDDTFFHIQSDTLFSALVNCYALFYPDEVPLFIEAFESGKIQLSSAFPCLEAAGGYKVFFLPKPMPYHRVTGGQIKKLKRIQYISLGVWREAPAVEDLINYPLIGGRFAMTEEERQQLNLSSNKDILKAIRPMSEDLHPKVRVHATDQTDVFYHQAVVQLNELEDEDKQPIKTQFFFLLDESLESPLKERLTATLMLLADEGIGGERSSGKGQIEEIERIKGVASLFPSASVDSSLCLLSLFIPASQEEREKIAQYNLVVRGGGSLGRYGDVEQHRRQVRMVQEGAIISEKVRGKLVELQPEKVDPALFPHPIYRNGLSFLLPFKQQTNG
ncbi:MAG: type III-A CRISPR-associated RAMP protein Csm4 [Bacteroidota bacterium]